MTPTLEISNLIKPIIDSFKGINAEWDNFFELGLSDYLHSQTDKYYFTNTFLHRSEKVRFKDIYFPIKGSYKLLTTDFSNLDEVFDEYKNITLVGSAGSGKTTLIKHIFLQTINNRKHIPILIELRNLNEYNGDFEKLLTEKVLKSNIKPNDATFNRTLASGKFLFLLDGYDEIFSNKKQEINRQIEMFVDSYPKNRFLITTRPGGGIESFPRFYDFKVESLDDNDVLGFISKIVEDGERKDRISQIVGDPKNGNYFEFLRNPLLLSMFIMAFENHPEIPKRKSAFYRNVFDTLYSKHDGITKNSFPREKVTKLQRDDFEEILAIFSYLTLIDGQYAFTQEDLTDVLLKVKGATDYNYVVEDLIYDLRTTISILILDGFEYSFPHRSMQEYFTAFFINKLPTDKKQKAYSNLSKALKESSNDYSFNFWSLCFELDETVFTSNFLIPELKKIYKLLEGKRDRALFDAYLELFDPSLLLSEVENTGKEELRIYRIANFRTSIINFCEAFDYMETWAFPVTSGGHDELLKLHNDILKNAHKSIFTSMEIADHEEIIEILIEYNMIDLVEVHRQKLLDRINKWESDVKRKKMNIDDILNA